MYIGLDSQRLCLHLRGCSNRCLLASACDGLKLSRPLVHATIEGFDGFIGRISRRINDLNAVMACCTYHRVHRDPAAKPWCIISSQLHNLIEIPGIALWIQFCTRR